jgi:hypothetical protein
MGEPIVFDKFKEIYDSLNLSDSDWVNQEAKKFFIKTKRYKNVTPQLMYVPDFLNKQYFVCSNGHRFKPNWLDKTHPLPPLRLRDGRLCKPIGVDTNCTVCGEPTSIKFPNGVLDMDGHVYGDEAIKDDLEGHVLISYSFISQPRRKDVHEFIEKEFLNLKSALVPHVAPTDWVVHFTELNNARKRKASSNFSHLTQKDILTFAKKIGRLISRFPKQLNKWNCTSVFVKPEVWKKTQVREYKSLVFYPLVLKVVDTMTCSNIAPIIHFEKTGDDGWATNRIIEGKCTLMWPFLTSGLPVSNPLFENPSTSIYFELADFISFVIARYLYVVGKRAVGEKVDFDYRTEWLGNILYMGSKKSGDIIMEDANKFPLRRFFDGTSWATET